MTDLSNKQLRLVIAGCGTAGFHGADAVMHDGHITENLIDITLADYAVIGASNAITCPGYAGHDDRPKTSRLEECIRSWACDRPIPIERCGRVEELDYSRLCHAGASGQFAVCALVGLDDWEARVRFMRGLRAAAAAAGREAWIVQSSFDRGGAQVTVLRADRWESPCTVCGIDVLPQEEPCVVLRRALASAGQPARDDLLRGDLRSEARAAAEYVVRVIGAIIGGHGADYADSKTGLLLDPCGGVQRETRPKRRMPGCWGPHDPKRRRLTIAEILA